ncbi:Alkyl hydroperoxide reductase [Fulvivirga imtechensis AK7]|uniref:Alkyl hydroperoxide reductase n=1 Tax=Fulvivirga imtechensis AK7 TaxID=1237149 RepID=L8JJL2_9BACT|nr:thioredoxin family protein [Fulvivirga imtechensis]ELR68433.1 Alkyl hydroperoxide reductase [Fulvivirga imtechensis AK7]
MALTPSKMLPLSTVAPPFKLEDTVSGRTMTLDELKSEKATVIMFICNHCPYVKHVQSELVKLAEDYIPEGVKFIAISSNDVENYPEDSPELMKAEARRWGYPFPYLYDETQAVARAYDAACTPDFYIFDGDMELVYRGQLDDSRPGNGKPLTGKDMRAALDDLLKGNPVTESQIPSQGCNIKWKK